MWSNAELLVRYGRINFVETFFLEDMFIQVQHAPNQWALDRRRYM